VRTKTPQQAEKILTVAARLFATHRFHEARMEDIAAEAGVGKGTLYRYFKDKEELYLALLERAADGWTRWLDAATEGIERPRARLEAFITAAMGYFDQHAHLFDLIQHAEAMQRPGTRFPWQQVRNHSRQMLLDLFEAGKKAGEFAIADPETAMLILQGGLRAIYRFGKKPRPPDLARRVLDILLHGATAPADGFRQRNGERIGSRA
jgi:AcrR family transcriptional regulator